MRAQSNSILHYLFFIRIPSSLKEILAKHHSEDSNSLLDRIIKQVNKHIGANPMEDDFTLLVSRRI